MRFFLIVFLLHSLKVFAQTGSSIGEWRQHPSLFNFKTVCNTGKYVYGGSQETLLRYRFEDNELRLLSKVDGLSDFGISNISHHFSLNLTFIAYINGNIDIINDDETVINISDIKRTNNISGSKKINDVFFHKNIAFLSTDFGLVLVDLVKYEIKESVININSTGNQLSVFSAAVLKDSVYILTNQGVLVSNINSNLLDFNSWSIYEESSGIPKDNLVGLTVYQDELYAAVSGYYNSNDPNIFLNSEKEGLYKLESGTWIMVLQYGDVVNSIVGGADFISASSIGKVFNYDGLTIDTLFVPGVIYETTEVYDDVQWIASHEGLIQFNLPGNFYFLSLSTRKFPNPFKLVNSNKNIYCLYGGYNPNTTNFFKAEGMDVYSENRWENFSLISNNFPGIYDLVDIAYSDLSETYYIASYLNGLVEFKDDRVVNTYNEQNSPLEGLGDDADLIRVTEVESDQNGNIWLAKATDSQLSPCLFKLTQNGDWTSYKLNFGSDSPVYLYNLEIDRKNNLWFTTRSNKGLYVFEPELAGGKLRQLNAGENSGGLPNINVNSTEIDLNGDIWIGTNDGLAIFRNDSDPQAENAYIPYFDGFPLLMGKVISDIEVDGGNRKWVATNDGLWLFNEDATEVLEYFTEKNSPLPTNKVLQVEVDGENGEVFILTDLGLLSYRGTATEAEESEFSDVKVFPNPVRPEFNGTISISGLARNVPVKITDVFGNLVYETFANGGTAVWDGMNYNGKKVESGVYLVFSSTADGEEGNIAKIVLIE